MKKTIITISICIGALLFTLFCVFTIYSFFPEKFENYSGWKEVEIEKCGRFKIPNDWQLHEEQDFFYITDEKSTPLIIQTYSDASYEDSLEYELGHQETNLFLDKIQVIKTISTDGLTSYGATYGKKLILKNDEEFDNYFLQIGYEGENENSLGRQVTFIVWNKTIDYQLVRKIAVSFVAVSTE